MGNSVLPPPPVMPSYSIAKDRPIRNIRPPHKYKEPNLVAYALSVVEDVESSKEIFCGVDSILGHSFVQFVIVNLFRDFVNRVYNMSKF